MTSSSGLTTAQTSDQQVAIVQMQSSELSGSSSLTSSPPSNTESSDTPSIIATDAPIPIALSEFTLFSELPPELRVIIWKHALLSRMFVVRSNGNITFDEKSKDIKVGYFPSAISQTTGESRQVFLENHELCSFESGMPECSYPSRFKQFYINFSRDIVSMSGKFRMMHPRYAFDYSSPLLRKLEDKVTNLIYNLDGIDRAKMNPLARWVALQRLEVEHMSYRPSYSTGNFIFTDDARYVRLVKNGTDSTDSRPNLEVLFIEEADRKAEFKALTDDIMEGRTKWA